MYYENYNPTLHDVYLYGPTNTGYPIGLNPNCLIYGAREDYASISLRPRAFNVLIESPPPGVGLSMLPNYYNTNSPIFTVVSPNSVMLNMHHTANKPSDAGSFSAKYTGLTSAYPIGSLYFWNFNFSGFSSYGPWTSAFNAMPLNTISGNTAYAVPEYFNGSPEIPGFSSGGTYYRIMLRDIGFMNIIGSGITMSQTKAKIVHPIFALTEEQKNNLANFQYIPSNIKSDIISGTYNVPVNNVYLWDGMDKIIPVSQITFYYADDNFIQYGASDVDIYFDGNYKAGIGDSSSQLIFVKDNKIYFIGGAYMIGLDEKTPIASQYISAYLPQYSYFSGISLDKNHYWYNHGSGTTLATKIDFTRIENQLENLINSMNSFINNSSIKQTEY